MELYLLFRTQLIDMVSKRMNNFIFILLLSKAIQSKPEKSFTYYIWVYMSYNTYIYNKYRPQFSDVGIFLESKQLRHKMFVLLVILCSHAMLYVTTARPICRVRWWQRSWPKPSRQGARWPKQWCLPPAVAWRAPPAHYFHDVSQPAQRRLADLRRPFSKLCSSSSIWRRRAHSVPNLHI